MATTITIEHHGPPTKMLSVRQFTYPAGDDTGPTQIGDPLVLCYGARVVQHVHDGNFFAVEEAKDIINGDHLVEPMTELLSFGDVLKGLVRGNCYARAGWNGAGQFIEGQFPDENSKMKCPYIFISPVDGMLVPWLASMTDMLANDWLMVPNSLDAEGNPIEAPAAADDLAEPDATP